MYVRVWPFVLSGGDGEGFAGLNDLVRVVMCMQCLAPSQERGLTKGKRRRRWMGRCCTGPSPQLRLQTGQAY